MITFTRAPTVAPGETITSTQFRQLGLAFNDRNRSGLGDGPWRLVYYWLSLFRQVRNSDESGLLFPPLAEFFSAGYQMLEPHQAGWPVAEAGDFEGANLASQMMAYVFGGEAIGLDPEGARLTNPESGGIPVWIDGGPPGTDLQAWELVKLQRGGYDPGTGGLGSPALTAARSHFRIAMSARSPHGNAYGGYLPTANLAEDPCEDPDTGDDIPAPLNYHIHFTNLVGGADQDYPGTCQPTGGTPYADHVAWIGYTHLAYYVFLNDGTVDVLPTNEFVEGPYTGEARLRKTANNGIPRMLNAFAREFRGSDSQRGATGYHLQEAFDIQRFLTTQYHLAPAIGSEGEGGVTPVYPLFQFTGATIIVPGVLANHVQSSTTEHQYADGFCATACMIEAVKLIGSATLEFLDGDDVVHTVTITADEAHNASRLVILPIAVSEPLLKVRLAAQASFTASDGVIGAEFTELLEYKPNHEDLFLALRVAGAIATDVTDGRGIDQTHSREIGEDYFTRGLVAPRSGIGEMDSQTAEVNTNAVFDAARRLSQCVRIIPRQQFAGYAVEGGKSVLWFKRRAQISAAVDMFAGIGPSRTALITGALIPGRTYIARGGTVTYMGTEYSDGQTFDAIAADTNFLGEGFCFEYDGIRHTAEPQGLTNEWLMGVELKAYHTSEGSLWKADSYSDYFPLVNRCHFYSPEIANDSPLVWHFAFGNRVSGFFGGVLSPESPSGYNYAPLQFAWGGHNNVNQIDCDEGDTDCEERRRNFYRSCRIYEPWPEIESAVSEFDGAEELVKLTFTGRLHHASSAPGSIDRDVGTWDVSALRAEASTIRTIENALREYLVQQDDGTNATADGPGNNAANSTVQSNPDNPFGSVYPHFLFTQLIPLPREDGNDLQDPTDTQFQHDPLLQMELYLRAMCEGYVDGATSAEYACLHSTSTLFDFSFQSLCLQAFGNRWMTLLPATARPDNPEGFGPLPNTEAYAALFNQLSSAVNLLTRVRVMLPMKLERAYDEGSATEFVNVTNADGTPADSCTPDGVCSVYTETTAPDAPVDPDPTWLDSGLIQSVSKSWLDGSCSGAGWGLTTSRINTRIRWQPADPDALEAIPESWRDMFDAHSVLLAQISRSSSVVGRVVTDLEGSEHCCLVLAEPCPGWWHVGGSDYLVFPVTTDTPAVTCEIMPSNLVAPPTQASTFARGRTPGAVIGEDAAECTPGPEESMSAVPILQDVGMIEVPLA